MDEEEEFILLDSVEIKIPDWEEYLSEKKLEYYTNKFNINEDEHKYKASDSDFESIETLCRKDNGKIDKVVHKETNIIYACKQSFIEQPEKCFSEKNILKSIKFPFTVNLEYYYEHSRRINLIMPYMEHGDLFQLLATMGKFPEALSKFYTLQVILAIEYLHCINIIYRGLKPENILLGADGYIKLADFSVSKQMNKGRTFSIAGTSEYLAPEMLLGRGYGKSVDFWSFGVLMYEFNAGEPPFNGNTIEMYKKILAKQYEMKEHFSKELAHLIKNLLKLNITKRYGLLRNGIYDIKEHNWYKPLPWMAVLNKSVVPPYMPDYSWR